MNTPLLHHQQPQRSGCLSPFLCWCFAGSKQRRLGVTSNNILKNGGLDVTSESYFHSLPVHHQNAIKLSLYMRYVFENHTNDLFFSKEFVSAMLYDDGSGREIDPDFDGVDMDISAEENDDEDAINKKNSHHSCDYDDEYHQEEHHIEHRTNNDDHMLVKGLPRRPFYKTLSIRIILLTQLYHKKFWKNEEKRSGDEKNKEVFVGKTLPRPVIDAIELGFTEKIPPVLEVFHFDQDDDDQKIISDIIHYMNKLQTRGIFEYLGLRSTVGTIIDNDDDDDNDDSGGGASYLDSIPSLRILLQAANQPHKPKSNPPKITLAGRARAKHAHRGKSQYFGVCKGSTQQKNEAAARIISDMIRNAAWINLHEFGGVNTPVFELRTKEGYGARWSICKNSRNVDVNDLEGKNQACMGVTFRGFLEPQMDDGFEKNWRH